MGSTFIMKVLLCLSIVLKLGTALKVNFDLDNLKEPLDNVSEAEFNGIFHKEPAQTEEEQRKREQALKANEKLIHDTNQRYDQGEIGWYDQLSDFSDLPAADFVRLKTGSIHKDNAATAEDDNDHGYALGRLDPKEEDMYDEESERYFDMFRYSRARVPRRYSSVKKRLCVSCQEPEELRLLRGTRHSRGRGGVLQEGGRRVRRLLRTTAVGL